MIRPVYSSHSSQTSRKNWEISPTGVSKARALSVVLRYIIVRFSTLYEGTIETMTSSAINLPSRYRKAFLFTIVKFILVGVGRLVNKRKQSDPIKERLLNPREAEFSVGYGTTVNFSVLMEHIDVYRPTF